MNEDKAGLFNFKGKEMKSFNRVCVYILGIFFFLTCSGCVYVTTHTKLNSDYSDHLYNKVVVISVNDDGDIAKQTENNVVDYFNSRNIDWVKCISFSENYYEGSTENKKSFKEKLSKFIKKNNVDGIIFISDGGLKLSTYITGMTSYSNGYTGVNTLTDKSIGLKMEFYDAITRDSIWYSKGGASSRSILRGQGDLISFFINDSLDKLVATGLMDKKE